MALLFAAPNERRRDVRDQRRKHSKRRQRSRRPVVIERQRYQPHAKNKGEVEVEMALIRAGIDFAYEPRSFTLTLTGRGKKKLRPDYYLTEFDIYIEVTQGNEYCEAFKQCKIRNAMANHAAVQIVLIGSNELRDLRWGVVTIWDLIETFETLTEDLWVDESAA